jgi:hypothetical protein
MFGDEGFVNRKPDVNIVELPRHLFIPAKAQSVDIRNLASITPGSSFDLLRFTAPPGGTTYFYGYAVFNDALLYNNVEFIPTVDGARIFPYHGNPDDNYKIALGVSSDVSNNALIQCAIQLNPGQVLLWRARNTDVVDVVMGVRMVGYLDSGNIRGESRIGG